MANTTLSRLGIAAGDRTKWTFSAWVKRSGLGSDAQHIFSGNSERTGGSNYTSFYFDNDQLRYYDYYNSGIQNTFTTNAKYRDVNGFYHLVLAYDSTQSTASNRVKLYVNGEQVTSFAATSYPGPSEGSFMNVSGNDNYIGNQTTSGGYPFSGSMSHIHFIDGTAYDASAFGETDTTTGEWVGKTSPSVTYGTNGFFILKDGNGITDQSGEGNDFTLGGGTLTDLKDNPENVFATLNPLDVNSDGVHTLSNGNLTAVNTAGAFDQTRSTYYLSTGKWYWEFKGTRGTDDGTQVGVVQNNYAGGSGERRNYQSSNGSKYSSSSSSYGATWTVGDIIGIALDLDNGTITFYKNGASQGVAFTDLLTSIDDTGWTPLILSYNGDGSFNFGNGYFGTTAITTNSGNGYAGAEGASKFNYQPPTGYSALSTKGLNE